MTRLWLRSRHPQWPAPPRFARLARVFSIHEKLIHKGASMHKYRLQYNIAYQSLRAEQIITRELDVHIIIKRDEHGSGNNNTSHNISRAAHE